jgi:hypothetical protein
MFGANLGKLPLPAPHSATVVGLRTVALPPEASDLFFVTLFQLPTLAG